MKRLALVVCGLLLPLGAAAAPLVAGLGATPNPAPAGSEVALTVTIERPTPLDIQRCDVTIDPGDGSAPIRVAYDIGDRRTKSVKHVYKKAGSYKVKATGDGRCKGTRDAALSVTPPGAKPATKAEPPRCPDGWKMEAVKPDSFTCRRL